jgi:hypothetical protein
MKIESIGMRSMGERQKYPRIYFHYSSSIMENMIHRYNNPYKEYRKTFPEIEKRLSLRGPINAVWNQNAGCSCGCSPGFIVKNSDDIGLYDDLFINIQE